MTLEKLRAIYRNGYMQGAADGILMLITLLKERGITIKESEYYLSLEDLYDEIQYPELSEGGSQPPGESL